MATPLGYTAAIKAVRAAGHKGMWIAKARTETLNKLLNGEITVAEAESITFGATAAAPANPFGALEETIRATAAAVVEAALDAAPAGGAGLEEAEVRKIVADAVTTAIAATPVATDTATAEEVSALKSAMADASKALLDVKTSIADALASGGRAAATVLAPIFGVASSALDPIQKKLELFCSPGRSLKPVLIKGEPGASKTYSARQWNYTAGFDLYVEVGVFEQTETPDLLGGPAPAIPWIDGPLAEAYRAAACGKTVLLVIDEYYRARSGTRQVLLTATSRATLPSGETVYRLRTGRPIADPETGVHKSEVIEAPCRNLAIVATTNVGAQFNIDMGCPAERDRFAAEHVFTTEQKLKEVLGGIATARGFGAGLVPKLIAFWKAGKVLRTDGFIELSPSMRILSESIEYAPDEKAVPVMLEELGLHVWCGTTIEGDPEPEQLKKLRATIKSSFGH